MKTNGTNTGNNMNDKPEAEESGKRCNASEEPQEKGTTPVHCGYCGSIIKTNYNFCPNCGRKITEEYPFIHASNDCKADSVCDNPSSGSYVSRPRNGFFDDQDIFSPDMNLVYASPERMGMNDVYASPERMFTPEDFFNE